ncbi:DUF4394 domain-containing protein [Microcoleus sp. FACHB-1515]|uniref:DUF4394 domain-containing protein n=1 Tax=Cyanophyceae TaxID=3028117 RepID=UPI0016849CA1|nr:DUF4394 domain-containing protein [Microcoleus sp. FACHB-1515]MBD2089837.1 DUF4394 domain-containing protein [Microcoleus sp. FACHB-1515]
MASNNSFDRAQNLKVLQQNRVIRDTASASDKVDFFSFRITRRSSFQGLLRGLRSNVDLTLFNSDRQRIATSRNPNRQNEAINTTLERGRYFIKTTRQNGQTAYRLRLSASSIEAPTATTAKFVGLTSDNSLTLFNSDNLTNVTRVALTGLQAGESLRGIDFRPNNGQLFGLGSTNRLYSIDLSSGAATQIGQPFAVPLNGTNFGFDFNPSVDRIRVVSDAGQNLRLNPDTGAVVDSNLATPSIETDGNLNGATTSIAATAYTESFGGATTTRPTRQLGINTTTDQLFEQNPPNAGTQIAIGSLGVDFSASAAFDIVTPQSGVNNAFGLSNSSLYSINLTTGAATLIGEVRDLTTRLNFVGLAARP